MALAVPVGSAATGSLYWIREKFVKRSGRAELVTSFAGGDYTDNGADFFINGAQKWLDLSFGHMKSVRRHVATLADGEWYLVVEQLRSVQKIWGFDSDGDRMAFEQADLHDLLDGLDTSDDGTPRYWAMNVVGVSPELQGTSLSGFDGTSDMVKVADDYFKDSGIIFDKPTDADIVVHVYGRFFERDMTSDSDKTFWTVMHPNVLVMAAMRELEIFHNNMEGVKNWTGVIADYLMKLGHDAAEYDGGEPREVVWG